MTHKEPKFAPKIALYQPDIPQNTASIIRTCSCLGIMLEIIEPCGFIINDRKFKRVVMDYYDAKNIQFYKSPEDFFISKRNYWTCDFKIPLILDIKALFAKT